MAKLFVALILPILLISCGPLEDRHVGTLEVVGLPGNVVNIYQQREFDHAVAIYYEIINSEKEILIKKYHLTGTSNFNVGIDRFTASSYDSIIYVTFLDPSIIYAAYDLRTDLGYPRSKIQLDYERTFKIGDDLIERIKSHNPDLKAS